MANKKKKVENVEEKVEEVVQQEEVVEEKETAEEIIEKDKKETKRNVRAIIILIIVLLLCGGALAWFYKVNNKEVTTDEIITKAMNEYLADTEKSDDYEEMCAVLKEYGFIIPNMNPSTLGNFYALDVENNTVVLISRETGKVVFPQDYDETNKANWIVSVGSRQEAEEVANYGYSLYFENDIETLNLKSLVNIDLAGYSCKSLTINDESEKSVVINGYIEKLNLNCPNGSVNEYGIVVNNYVNNVKEYTVHGYIETFNIEQGGIVVDEQGCIKNLVSKDSAKKTIVNNGKVVAELSSEFEKSGKGIYDTDASKSLKYNINSLEELILFREQVNMGRDFAYTTVYLNCSVDLSELSWEPIGNKITPFTGSFNGQGNTIKGLKNEGYVDDVISITEGTEKIGNVYGFFGVIGSSDSRVLNQTFSNIIFEDVNIDANGANMIGALFGSDTAGIKLNTKEADSFTIENITVTGSISCSNTTGGMVGGVAGKVSTSGAVTFKNCTNKAALTSSYDDSKVEGIVGSYNSAKVKFESCVNEGKISVK